MAIKNESYITIQGWMANELGLKGNELLVYAIIYGFSQDNESRFTGSLGYLASWTSSTKQGVSKAIKSLIEKGLIKKFESHKNGVKFVEYCVSEFNTMQQSCIGGMQQSLTNNISIDNIDIKNSVNTYTKKESVDTLFDRFWNEYPKKIDKAKCKKWFEKNKPNEQLVNKMLETIIRFKTYSEQWKKDNGRFIPYPLTWLNGGRWDDELTVEIRQQTPVSDDFKHQCTVVETLSAEDEEYLRKRGR